MHLSLRFLLCALMSLSISLFLNFAPVIPAASLPAWAEDENSIELIEEEAPEVEIEPAKPAKKTSEAAKPVTALESKIDVNNTILRNYRLLPGFYPTLARVLVQNAPYEKVDDVLKIPGLTNTQKELIRANLDNFVAGPYRAGDNQLENRINKGYYG